MTVDNASDAGVAAGVGFGGSFSRDCEQVFRAASMGAFLTMKEFRDNLRIAGMVLGPDEIETPGFELPDLSVEQFAYEDDVVDDVDGEDGE